MKRKLLNVPLAVGAAAKPRPAPVYETSTAHAAGKPPGAHASSARALPKQNPVVPKTVTTYDFSGVLLNDSPAQGPAKRRKLLLVSRQGEPLSQPAASISTPIKSTSCRQEPRKAVRSTTALHGPGPPKLLRSTQQSAAACEKLSPRALTPETQTTRASPASKSVDQVTKNASSTSGSPPASTSAAAVTALDKSAQQPPLSSATSTAGNESIASPATKESAPHAAETGLSAKSAKRALSIPLQLAASPTSTLTSEHGKSTLLTHTAQMHRPPVPWQQANTPSKETGAVLPMLKETLAAKTTAEAKAGAGIVPSSMQDRFMQDADNLLMIRRLPAVLTGTLPTLDSLGVQVSLPSGADLLSEASSCCIQRTLNPRLGKVQLFDIHIFKGLP
ncbi:hypothetical protein ABBQ38_011550 [Trebouxia sp. C0009 RCD-2024]